MSPHTRAVGGLDRRAALGAGAAGLVVTSRAAPAQAAERASSTSYAPGSWPATPVLSAPQRHLVGRFSYGVTQLLATQVRRAGSASAWFEQQLDPAAIDDPVVDGLGAWWPDLGRRPADLWQRQITGVRGGWEVMNDYAAWLMARRMTTQRQLLETMTEFWEDHLHVPVTGDNQFTWRVAYGLLMRKHALGRFDQLLPKAVTHPAMTIFLDGVSSTKDHPNENLGREVLELHSVGVGHYTEDDVISSARILTGYSVDAYGTWAATYNTADHWTGAVKVGTFRDANRSADGRATALRYLQYLARHPDTATRIATKLAVRFCSDTPSAKLVRLLAKTYLDHQTAIKPVLRVLVASEEFKAARDTKLREPAEDVVASYRALGMRLAPPVDSHSAANAMIWQAYVVGLMPGSWPRPDGRPSDNAAWSSPLRALSSLDLHWTLGNRWWPTAEVTYPDPATWVPTMPIAFRDLVDHLSRRMLNRRSTSQLLRACCLVMDVEPTASITADHPIASWDMGRLLATVLDSPGFYLR